MKTFIQNMFDIYGEKAEKWLNNLPELITQLSKKWNLSNLKPLNNLSYNYVLEGWQENKPIILKLSLDLDAICHEVRALQAFQGHGMIELISHTKEAILVLRATPGRSLKQYFPEYEIESIEIAAKLMKKLHSTTLELNTKFPQLYQWLQDLDKDWEIPLNILLRARNLREELLSTTTHVALLHGDLHHENILENNGEWVVIDPKGVIGDIHYEIATFIRNPIPELLSQYNHVEIINQRIDKFAKLFNTNHLRIKNWCFIQSVLSWGWALEDRNYSDYFKNITMILAKD